MIKHCDKADAEKIPITRSWLGREGLYSIEILTTEEQEMCNSSTGLFQMLNKNSIYSTMK